MLPQMEIYVGRCRMGVCDQIRRRPIGDGMCGSSPGRGDHTGHPMWSIVLRDLAFTVISGDVPNIAKICTLKNVDPLQNCTF